MLRADCPLAYAVAAYLLLLGGAFIHPRMVDRLLSAVAVTCILLLAVVLTHLCPTDRHLSAGTVYCLVWAIFPVNTKPASGPT